MASERDEEGGTGTLGKAMSVLEAVALAERPMRFTDVLAVSGQPRGTLHRQLSHLVQEGLLELRPDHAYVPGLRLLKLASASWARNEFRAVAAPFLEALHRQTGETVHLGVLRGREIIYLDKVESRQAVRMNSQIGNASPAYCTGVGKAALAALDAEALDALLSGLEFRRFTPQTITSRAALLDELARIRLSGIAFDREEHEPGIRCVAAPVFDAGRALVAGVSVTGPAYRVGEVQLDDWAPRVRHAAGAIMAELSARLGPQR
ncbi:IclR family transcriptional regulator [Shinella yambaruensis]|uniref:IclR family transcriptional regulator n=1 Tax=Shinella yambaruensis TaxID=415996 RepID=UPI001FCFD6EB|nr:IclR family transcriptional regulator [Shinella yambaruensis]MCJ8026489.1 IclR family transcriptional regulator [Shinella yambaruensis]MCU7982283.1 IclR family transcriptional regulator [Shinella yambaruensis]